MTDPFAAAILLAAAAAGDEGARAAALDPELERRLDEVRRATAAPRALGRESALAALVSATAERPTTSAAPPRARALIASLAPREIGAAWMREAGAPRAGFRASAPLRATIVATEDDAWRA